MDMGMDMCTDMCRDMCIDMCIDTGANICVDVMLCEHVWSVFGHARRPMHRHVHLRASLLWLLFRPLCLCTGKLVTVSGLMTSDASVGAIADPGGSDVRVDLAADGTQDTAKVRAAALCEFKILPLSRSFTATSSDSVPIRRRFLVAAG